jgi:hypothetical protein
MSLVDDPFPWLRGNNFSAVAFAYISTRNDSLKLNSSIHFAPPMQYTLQAQVWSFVNNDTQSKPPAYEG